MDCPQSGSLSIGDKTPDVYADKGICSALYRSLCSEIPRGTITSLKHGMNALIPSSPSLSPMPETYLLIFSALSKAFFIYYGSKTFLDRENAKKKFVSRL